MIRHIYLIGAATLFLFIQMSSANALELKLTPPSINLANEDTSFTITIVIENVSNIKSPQVITGSVTLQNLAIIP